MITLAKGNRSKQVTTACKKHGGFYLGSIGGPAAILAQNNIKKVRGQSSRTQRVQDQGLRTNHLHPVSSGVALPPPILAPSLLSPHPTPRPPAPRPCPGPVFQVEVLEYAELGMEAIWRIEVENFPAFIVVDNKGEDFFATLL